MFLNESEEEMERHRKRLDQIIGRRDNSPEAKAEKQKIRERMHQYGLEKNKKKGYEIHQGGEITDKGPQQSNTLTYRGKTVKKTTSQNQDIADDEMKGSSRYVRAIKNGFKHVFGGQQEHPWLKDFNDENNKKWNKK